MRSHEEIFAQKVAPKFFGQVRGNPGNNPSHPKHLPAPTHMPGFIRKNASIVFIYVECF